MFAIKYEHTYGFGVGFVLSYRHQKNGDRFVACVRVLELPVQAEVRRRADLKDRAFAIASGLTNSTGVIVGASPKAQELGLRTGMSVREAMSCKEVALLSADLDYYQEIHIAFVDALEQRVPDVEEGDLGCVYVDLTDMKRLYPRAEVLFKLLQEAVLAATGLSAQVGAGPNKFVASVAADKAKGGILQVSALEVPAFLASCSIDYLLLTPETQRKLTLLGLHCLGDIARIDMGAFVAQFGNEGRQIWDLAHGIDPSPVIPRKPFRPLVERLFFPASVVEWEPFWAGLQQLLIRVWGRKERKKATVRQLEIIASSKETSWQKRITFGEPIGDLDRLKTTVRRRLDGVVLHGAVDELTLKITHLGGAYVRQETLFAEKAERFKSIREAFEPLKARYGTTGLYRVTEVEPWSRIPERRYALISFDP